MPDIKDLTLEEKAYLLSGKSYWEIIGVDRIDLKSIIVTDGPHGIRKSQNISSTDFNANKSEIAICYPTASALACSFNTDLIYQMGEYLGEACQAMNVRVLLGPGNNIKRTPLCGRNFEYFSEDPYLASKMATAEIMGIQSKGVGSSLKHFVANNQERRRNTINAIIDERTLREIYLAAFEEPVKIGKPWTIMGAYNRVNGLYMCENPYFLRDILRDEWGYEGVILTDWTATDQAHVSIRNGLDLEMPTSGDVGPRKIIKAAKDREFMKEVDRAAENVINLLTKAEETKVETSYDLDAHHQKAREIAHECIVLLKNNENTLPISPEKYNSVAIIGKFAKEPRYQGGGSSHINSYRVDTVFEEFTALSDIEIKYADGYSLKTDITEEEIIFEAVNVAKPADIVLLFVGLPDVYETEGIDRKHLDMPPNHIELINRVTTYHDNVVLIISAGSVVKIPYLDRVNAVMNGWLTGEAGAGAIVDGLLGIINPSGKLSESFITDEIYDPSMGNYPGNYEVLYDEGIYVGYRYHDKAGSRLQFEFGFGLSYTQFKYSDIEISNTRIHDTGTVDVKMTITNTGNVSGKEIVQLYVSELNPIVDRPDKELKGFSKIELQAGESKNISFTLDKRSFAYYNVDIKDWHVNSGIFRILIGKSSRDIVLETDIEVISSNPVYEVTQDKIYVKRVEFIETNRIHRNTSMETIKDHLIGKRIYKMIMKQVNEELAVDEVISDKEYKMLNPEMMITMINEMPLRSFVNATGGDAMTDGNLRILILLLNLTRPDTILGKILGIFSRKK